MSNSIPASLRPASLRPASLRPASLRSASWRRRRTIELRASTLAVGLAVAASSLLATSASAWAEVTAEQEEACTPDAVKLCSDTIPDIPKTTACMKAHVAQLSPRCRVAFDGAMGSPAKRAAKANAPDARSAPRSRVATRIERRDRDVDVETPVRPPYPTVSAPPSPLAPGPFAGLPTIGDTPDSGRVPGLTSYKANIANLCRQGLIDPFTCRNTMDALSLSE